MKQSMKKKRKVEYKYIGYKIICEAERIIHFSKRVQQQLIFFTFSLRKSIKTADEVEFDTRRNNRVSGINI